MNCNKFAQQLGSNPHSISPEQSAHMAECEVCTQLSMELKSFDEILKSAIEVNVPSGLGQLKAPTHSDNVVAMGAVGKHTSKRQLPWFALAATVLLGIGITLGSWVSKFSGPLSSNLVAHIAHESGLLGPQWSVVPVAEVQSVLLSGHVSLNGDIGTVRHAGLCLFRGNKVAHMVVHTDNGPITVMLLPDEPVSETQTFSEGGYEGLLVPLGKGSIAILGNDAKTFIELRDKLVSTVEWSI